MSRITPLIFARSNLLSNKKKKSGAGGGGITFSSSEKRRRKNLNKNETRPQKGRDILNKQTYQGTNRYEIVNDALWICHAHGLQMGPNHARYHMLKRKH